MTTTPTSPVPDECWSFDGESFCYDSLDDLIDSHRSDLSVGDVVYVGTTLRYRPERFFDVDFVIDNARDNACDEGGESAEDWLDDVTTEDKAELQAALGAWAAKFPVQFYGVSNPREITITTEHLA